MTERTVHWIVTGRVQGVGYRYFTERVATSLGVRGTVRNLSDGTVEITAAGSPESLATFHARLRVGPEWSEVESIEDRGAPPGPLPAGFEVRF